MIATIVLGILMIGFIFSGNGFTGNVVRVSEDVAVKNFENFAQSKGIDVEVIDVTESDLYYEISFSTDEGDSYVYVSKDGENIISGVIPMVEDTSSSSSSKDVPKTDKPVVELFIWGYCPYGVQAQGPLANVAKLLSDFADFKAVLYYDGHGDYETQQNKIQECIQEVAPDKYWNYAEGFVNDIYPKCNSQGTASNRATVDCDLTESTKLMNSLGIDSEAVFACVDEKGDDLLKSASQRARELGVTGSPTLAVNGVSVNVARTEDAFQTAVCSGFNEAPEECFVELDSTETAAAGNC